ncbi:MAG: glycosyltransferase family 4 protein [Magnetococcales bacterium]|nr:glycosyltransferase family 4 protein [Magnetococcales bacterium]NGZ27022.1 glycosyltransferase family 4 protein [Magnetococcales bacterium]
MSLSLSQLHLVVCLTRGGSLSQWQKSGLLGRELALYRALLPHLAGITLVSYGNDRSPALQDALAGIRVVDNPWQWQTTTHQRLLTLFPRSWSWQKTIFKSNQLLGAELAIHLGERWHQPTIVRCGFPFARFRARQYGEKSEESRQANLLESQCFHKAHRIVLTSPAMVEEAISDHGLAREKMRVIPNYVDCSLFTPPPQPPDNAPLHVLFIGRMEEQKNISSLLQAMTGVPAHLTLLGEGSLLPQLTQEARQRGIQATFLPPRPHHQLPQLMQQADIFILPSLYEGHPKVLLEAMACGLAVIGCPVPGVAEIVQHNKNGLLAPPNPQGLHHALQTLINNPTLRQTLGQQAAESIRDHFSLAKVVELELALLEEISHNRWQSLSM